MVWSTDVHTVKCFISDLAENPSFSPHLYLKYSDIVGSVPGHVGKAYSPPSTEELRLTPYVEGREWQIGTVEASEGEGRKRESHVTKYYGIPW